MHLAKLAKLLLLLETDFLLEHLFERLIYLSRRMILFLSAKRHVAYRLLLIDGNRNYNSLTIYISHNKCEQENNSDRLCCLYLVQTRLFETVAIWNDIF